MFIFTTISCNSSTLDFEVDLSVGFAMNVAFLLQSIVLSLFFRDCIGAWYCSFWLLQRPEFPNLPVRLKHLENENNFHGTNFWISCSRMPVSKVALILNRTNWPQIVSYSDFDLEIQCKEICHESTIDCISDCTTPDSTCISQCSREEVICFNSCPCETDCPLGCLDCNHPICEINRKSVLVLRKVFDYGRFDLFCQILNRKSTFAPSNVPMIIAFSGYNNQDLNFVYEDSSSYWSCGLTFLGEFFVFGGKDSHMRQVKNINYICIL